MRLSDPQAFIRIEVVSAAEVARKYMISEQRKGGPARGRLCFAVCCGPVVDLLAFNPAAPGCWALRRGNATVLGAIDTRWLRSDCRGLVLLTGDRHKAAAILRRISNIDAEDEAHAAELECDGAATLITVSLDGRVKGYGLQSEREFVLTSGIHRAVASREAKVLAALGIGWQTGRPHITCQYPRHADDNPSWRWELREAQVFGICIEKSASAFDAAMSRTILDLYSNPLTSRVLKGKIWEVKAKG